MCGITTERMCTMKSEVEKRAQFVSFCIEQYAKAKNMTTEDVVNLFAQYGITEHFCEFYDVAPHPRTQLDCRRNRRND